MKKVLMLAAEHGGLKGGKVGGIGDVIEQLPPALVATGTRVDVLLPSYGVYHLDEGAELIAQIRLEFAGSDQTVQLYRLAEHGGAGCLVVHHPLFAAPAGQIYHHDPDDQPFATDANIYALFCASAFELLCSGALEMPDVVHLHDWHAATFAVLARSSKALKSLKLVYTIHNLALQGTRPFTGHPSSFTSWFANFDMQESLNLNYLRDPIYPDCYNPTRAALRLVDKIHVVSPTYALEVLESNDLSIGLHGGEGLEFDLQLRADAGDVVGILNGCSYPAALESIGGATDDTESFAQQRQSLLRAIRRKLGVWFSENDALRSSDYLARETLNSLSATMAGRFLVTSVGRVTDQKVGLLLHKGVGGKGVEGKGVEGSSTLLDRLLEELGEHGCFVMLGSGDVVLERQLVEHAARHQNFIYLRGYSGRLADSLYEAGDLFLMPSLFEPCGISQLMAMRAGQPCLVNATGGLKDTVSDDVDGFLFDGLDLDEKAMNCELALKRALRLRASPRLYREMRVQARTKRITWGAAARAYVEHLYADSGTNVRVDALLSNAQ